MPAQTSESTGGGLERGQQVNRCPGEEMSSHAGDTCMCGRSCRAGCCYCDTVQWTGGLSVAGALRWKNSSEKISDKHWAVDSGRSTASV